MTDNWGGCNMMCQAGCEVYAQWYVVCKDMCPKCGCPRRVGLHKCQCCGWEPPDKVEEKADEL